MAQNGAGLSADATIKNSGEISISRGFGIGISTVAGEAANRTNAGENGLGVGTKGLAENRAREIGASAAETNSVLVASRKRGRAKTALRGSSENGAANQKIAGAYRIKIGADFFYRENGRKKESQN